MKHQVYAVGVIFEDTDGDILVLRRHQNSPEGNTWGLVGGNIDEGEDGLIAAIRETSEEIDHTIASDDLLFLKSYEWHRPEADINFEVYKYKIPKDNVDINLDTEENTEHLWAQPEDLLTKPDLMVGLYPILEDEYELTRGQALA